MKTKMIVITILYLALNLIIALPSSAITLNVPGDYPNIQTAIDAASDGEVVLVAAGNYTGPLNKDLSFHSKAITVISDTGPEDTIIDCEGDGRGFYFDSEGPDSVLSGFTIRNGYIEGQGGGIKIENASPTITNCIIKSNKARFNSDDPESGVFGGGIYIYNIPPIEGVQNFIESIEFHSLPEKIANKILSKANKAKIKLEEGKESAAISKLNAIIELVEDKRGKKIPNEDADILIADAQFTIWLINSPSPTITNSTIENNSVWEVSDPYNPVLGDTRGNGGGMYCWNSSPIITNCDISGNEANDGAGLSLNESSPSITDCDINNNWAFDGGGGITVGGNSAPHISECIISGNEGLYGGGVCIYGNPSLIITNCTITGNITERIGSGIAINGNDTASIKIVNCTLDENGIDCNNDTSTPIITNNILFWSGIGCNATVTYSNIYPEFLFYPGTGNISEDPLFVGTGDYHLNAGSACIDTGTSVGAPDIDIDGEIRPYGSGYDMGSDEYTM
jgi:parallel beta helix pectate lyase-like protein